MITARSLIFAAMTAAPLYASPASAHMLLDLKEATVGGSLRIAFQVPHGCGGSPTVKLRVRIPDGVIAVKPMPKAGWQVETVKGKYDKGYPYFGNVTLTEGVKEVAWSGGKLPDDQYDEFVLSGFLAADLPAGQMLYFPVVQDCESGTHRWIEIPAAGKTADDYKEPAPALKLMPKAGVH
jgi:uncharacterized protein YcnI